VGETEGGQAAGTRMLAQMTQTLVRRAGIGQRGQAPRSRWALRLAGKAAVQQGTTGNGSHE